MKVTGYQLREAIKMKHSEVAILNSQYEETLYAFDGDKKKLPHELIYEISKLEAEIALLQTAQSWYNVNVKIHFNGREMLLENAVKLVGGISRCGAMWRIAAEGTKRDRYTSYAESRVRKKDEEVAQLTVDKEFALSGVKQAAKEGSALRGLISSANNNSIEIEFIDEKLLS